jgi:hypothetical protein
MLILFKQKKYSENNKKEILEENILLAINYQREWTGSVA